ncbi:MAG: hypothetical protein ABJL99_00500 [Aliishimia sp.]
MKANFALSLSFDGIRLLHRAAGGWRRVGEIALDAPDLPSALRLLRKTALGLEPSGLRTKLIIPDSQIKYLTIDTGDASTEDRIAAAKTALDGATPYLVADLAFDISPDGDQTHVAAVAQDTLAEAEAFAVQHRFSPISCVAIPNEAGFLGEPFFGPTVHAGTIMEPEDVVDADGVAVVIIGDIAHPVDDESDPAPGSVEDPIEAPTREALVEQSDGTENGVEVLYDEDVSDVESLADANDLDEAAAEPELVENQASEDAEGRVENTEPSNYEEPSWESADQIDEPELVFDDGVNEPEPEPEPEIAPEGPQDSSKVVTRELTPDPSGPASHRHLAVTRILDDENAPSLGGVTRDAPTIPTPESANILAASIPEMGPVAHNSPFEREISPQQNPAPRRPDVPGAPDLSAGPEAAAATLRKPTLPLDEDSPNDVVPMRVRSGGFFSRRRKELPPILTKPPAPNPVDKAAAKKAKRSERQRMTVFGARKPEPANAVVVGGKPRFLGLMLTAVLLVFLAGVAAWASVFIDNGLARLFGPRVQDIAITSEELEPEPEIGSPILTTSLDPILKTAPPPTLLQPEPLVAPAFDDEEAKEYYAITGIWVVAPKVPYPPQLVPLDNLYITSIDPANPSFDSVALPAPQEHDTDKALNAPSSPAPAGTVFALDSRGLVIPTPQGALSPDGITVFLGRPPVLPPSIPDRAAQTPEVTTETDQALATVRPRVRPSNLVENTERRNLGGVSLSELKKFRPQLRPETQKVEEEKDETPTAQAVISSLRPDARPRNFDRLVARAQTRRETTPAPTTTQPRETSTVAPRTVSPSIPSSASVTRQATVKNAINLRRVNLMGVYGKPSSRSALVRLANGRFRKVKVGDRIDGGRVSAIGDSELRYQKNGRNITLSMPRT